jgi:hypothetical protein
MELLKKMKESLSIKLVLAQELIGDILDFIIARYEIKLA